MDNELLALNGTILSPLDFYHFSAVCWPDFTPYHLENRLENTRTPQDCKSCLTNRETSFTIEIAQIWPQDLKDRWQDQGLQNIQFVTQSDMEIGLTLSHMACEIYWRASLTHFFALHIFEILFMLKSVRTQYSRSDRLWGDKFYRLSDSTEHDDSESCPLYWTFFESSAVMSDSCCVPNIFCLSSLGLPQDALVMISSPP